MKKNSFLAKLKNFIIESDEEEEVVEEEKPVVIKKEDVTIQLVKEEPKPIETKKPEPKQVEPKKAEMKKPEVLKAEEKVVTKKPETTETAKIVEKTEEKKASKTFMNMSEKTTGEKKAEKQTAREAYRPAQVISPIFGNSQVDSYNIGASQLVVDEEKTTTSVIGTVFSPMYGKDLVKVTVEDEVDAKVASMTTKDFLTKGVKKEVVEEKVESKVEAPVTLEQPKQDSEEILLEEAEKAIEKIAETYENLTLFD